VRYRLRSVFFVFVIVAVILSGAVSLVHWWNSRSGQLVTQASDWPNEVHEVTRRLGSDALQDLQVWHLYGGWFGFDFVWRAKAPPEAVKCLQQVVHVNAISEAQVPSQFWKMPRDWSEMPNWWDPTPVDGAEYYMSPSFVPRSVINGNLDCVAMYDPERQILYVWSQWDY
jgi:hypothetical protein